MTTITEIIEKRNYSTLDDLDNDIDVLENFFDYSDGTYVCDAISEISDSNVSVYNYDVWQSAPKISDYIEEAIAEGLADTSSNNINLVRIFQAGWYQYNNTLLYNNIDSLVFNYVADKVNEHLNKLDSIDNLDIEDITSDIENETENFDHNNAFSYLDDIANNIIEAIDNDNYQL